jgi:hypothetical protein
VSCEPLEEALELSALMWVERREQLVLGPGDRTLRLHEAPLAGRGQPDEVPAAVGGVPWADDQAVRLERVEEPHEVARVDPKSAAKLLLGERSGLVEVVEDRELVSPHLKGGECLS